MKRIESVRGLLCNCTLKSREPELVRKPAGPIPVLLKLVSRQGTQKIGITCLEAEALRNR